MIGSDGMAAEGAESARTEGSIARPDFISHDVWSVVKRAAEINKISVVQYVEKALLDEAYILEQERFGRTWLVEDGRGRIGRIDFT